jgi:hypothetical protein
VKKNTELVLTILALMLIAVAYAALYFNESSQTTYAHLAANGTSYVVQGNQQVVVDRLNVTTSKAYLNGGFEGNGTWYFVVVAESQYSNFSANPLLAVTLGGNVWDLQIVSWRPNFNYTMSDQLRSGTYYVVIYNPKAGPVVVTATQDLLLQKFGIPQG